MSNNKKPSIHDIMELVLKQLSFICFNCNEPGHIAPNCPHPKCKCQQASAVGCPVTARVVHEEVESTTQEVSNMYSHEDDTLTMLILNDIHVTLHFEAYKFMTNN
jgi:hypothetical protein